MFSRSVVFHSTHFTPVFHGFYIGVRMRVCLLLPQTLLYNICMYMAKAIFNFLYTMRCNDLGSESHCIDAVYVWGCAANDIGNENDDKGVFVYCLFVVCCCYCCCVVVSSPSQLFSLVVLIVYIQVYMYVSYIY